MKSSKRNKASVVDDISRETQRLISDSHVRLPYHKSKQKTLKDFLNRQKNHSTEFQASITGSKKLLQKAWEFIENKEKNVEKFYNEDSAEIEQSPSKKDDKELNVTLSKNDENSSEETSLCYSTPQSQQVLIEQKNECLESNLNFNNFEKHTDCHSSIKNKNENVYELYDSSDYEESVSSSITDEEEDQEEVREEDQEVNEEDQEVHEEDQEEVLEEDQEEVYKENHEEVFLQEEFSRKKKRKLIALPESSDDENDSIKDIKLTSSDLNPLFDERKTNISTQQLMGLCSGEFQTQLSQEKYDSEDSFDSVVPINDTRTDEQSEDMVKIPELISAKDFFEDEAELSESDWSSDDEEHLVDKIDNFEVEAGDDDNLDESAIKNGLDKIYMRQLLDDDQKQVTTLKEMLFEEGDLFSDSSRKRKFQWDETDENDSAIGKPLFSDNDDENENDDENINSEQWRNERFKRESYLLKKNKYANDYIEEIHSKTTDSSDIAQTSISAVKKTHIVKYRKEEITNLSNTDESLDFNDKSNLENDKILSTSISVITDTQINKVNNNGLIHNSIANVIASKPNKLLKGSFINRISKHKLNTALLYINKKPVIPINVEKQEDNIDIKSVTTLAVKANTNPFAYLLRNEDKKELSSDNLNNVKEKDSYLSQSYIKSTRRPSQTKSISSILKHLE